MLGTVAVCLLPWLAYSYVTVGTVQQDSGAMKMLWHQQFWQGRGTAALATDVCLFMAQTWLAFPLANLLGRVGIVPPLALGVCSLLLAVARLGRAAGIRRRRRSARSPPAARSPSA